MLNSRVFNAITWNSPLEFCLCWGILQFWNPTWWPHFRRRWSPWTKIVGSLRVLAPKSTSCQDLVKSSFHSIIYRNMKRTRDNLCIRANRMCVQLHFPREESFPWLACKSDICLRGNFLQMYGGKVLQRFLRHEECSISINSPNKNCGFGPAEFTPKMLMGKVRIGFCKMQNKVVFKCAPSYRFCYCWFLICCLVLFLHCCHWLDLDA